MEFKNYLTSLIFNEEALKLYQKKKCELRNHNIIF